MRLDNKAAVRTALILALVASILFSTAAYAQLGPQVFVTGWIAGPNGDSLVPCAHVSETVDVHVLTFNLTDFWDSMTVSSVFVPLARRSANVVVPNLLPDPITATNSDDLVEIVTRVIVQRDDPDYLEVRWEVIGTDNSDGPGGSGIPKIFSTEFGDHVHVFKPALEVSQQCAIWEGCPEVQFSGIVTNTGNTELTNLTVVSDGGTFNLGTLSVGGFASYAGSYVAKVGASTAAVTASGTDALGLTISNSGSCNISLPASPTLTIAPINPGTLRVSWPVSSQCYRLESKNAGQSWVSATNSPTMGSDGLIAVTVSVSKNSAQFYRLVIP